MSVLLIREYVKLALDERIKSKSFRLSEFEALDDVKNMQIYCDAHLQRLGRGSGRIVYLVSSGRVIKIAYDDGGHDQNRAEATISEHPAAEDIVAKVFDTNDDYDWIMAELVRPITSEEEFSSLIGVPGMAPENLTRIAFASNKREQALMLKRFEHGQNAMLYIDGIRTLNKRFELNRWDLERLEHWGKTSDGRLVLLDYGLVHNIGTY